MCAAAVVARGAVAAASAPAAPAPTIVHTPFAHPRSHSPLLLAFVCICLHSPALIHVRPSCPPSFALSHPLFVFVGVAAGAGASTAVAHPFAFSTHLCLWF